VTSDCPITPLSSQVSKLGTALSPTGSEQVSDGALPPTGSEQARNGALPSTDSKQTRVGALPLTGSKQASDGALHALEVSKLVMEHYMRWK
jgi:hypothetical protein